ncbi:MAG: hypothetical protein COT91_03015 [Candidatus Doudnabacteria bacterium CG10_big_fil_rev_8_21_14_0_10_41_10]|uniref:Uncharacterized protein n=1 Tax=Candidatus Doudnabacteria bacterium CG10_big_fil_rev_8_21_14_0_10_41_10 TaxID=1974551 RepID=A0A2H0VDK8_9BACT|nr:MAG: hypothetical protein COT91_03015 [Candidatus Doudnabacteria bacterium CG10_big_fil_rev_8_21_14_0_10_41_10]
MQKKTQNSVFFSFKIRQATVVANAVARHILAQEGTAPSGSDRLMSIKGMETLHPSFSYEGGTVVQVSLFDASLYEPNWKERQEDWVVLGALASYRVSGQDQKVRFHFNRYHLQRIKEGTNGWVSRPDVAPKYTGHVSVYRSNQGKHRILWDQDNQFGGDSNWQRIHWVGFDHPVKGNRERAEDAAREWLYQHLLALPQFEGNNTLAHDIADGA